MERVEMAETIAAEPVELADPYLDPAAYLHVWGIEAELVAVVEGPVAPAA